MGTSHNKKWLKQLIKPLMPAFREVMLLSLFVNILALGLPVFVLQVYDRVVFFQGTTTLVALVGGIAVVIVFDFVLRQARSRILQRAALLIDVKLGRELFDKISALPLRILEHRPASYWHSLYRDADTVRNMYSGPSAVLATELPFVPLFVILIFVIAAPIAWLLLIIIPVFMIIAWLSGAVLDRASRQERTGLLRSRRADRRHACRTDHHEGSGSRKRIQKSVGNKTRRGHHSFDHTRQVERFIR